MKIKPIFFIMAIICYGSVCVCGYAETQKKSTGSEDDLQFDQQLFELDHNAPKIDLSLFNDSQYNNPPGTYWVNIYVNGHDVTQQNIDFILDKKQLKPKLPMSLLDHLPLKTKYITLLKSSEIDLQLEKKLPYTKVTFDFATQRINISIPQKYLAEMSHDVSEKQWDEGIPAVFVNYDFSGENGKNYNHDRWDHRNSLYLNLQTGLNYKNWRLRSYFTWSQESSLYSNHNQWNMINSYLETDVPNIHGQLILGQYYTTSSIFENFPFLGMNLSSDIAMIPDRQLGYAPIVRGIADTESTVSIYQYNRLIYQINVPAGPFEINNLYDTGSNGDLTVEVKGYDGKINKFTVPFASLPNLQREGKWFYDISLGNYKYHINDKNSLFFQNTLTYGLPYNTSIYGGLQFSPKYQAMSMGLGYNLTNLGAISFQIIQAYSHFDTALNTHKIYSGQAYRILYSKNISNFGTNFELVGYRYATEHFYTFSDVEDFDHNKQYNPESIQRKKSQLNLTVNQSIPDLGSVYINSTWTKNYNEPGYQNLIQAGLNSSWHSLLFSINLSHQHDQYQKSSDNTISFSLSIPFYTANTSNWVSYQLTKHNESYVQHQVNIYGYTNNNQFNYSLQQSYSQQHSGNTSGNIQYNNKYGNMSAGFYDSSESQNIHYNLSGGILFHKHGVTLGEKISGATALVYVPQSKNVKISSSYNHIYTDSSGYAIVPDIMPYRRDAIELMQDTLADNVELYNNIQQVIPTENAIVLAKFKSHIGYRALIKIDLKGSPLPFASHVYDANNLSNQGLIDDNGEVYLSGLSKQGELLIKYQDTQPHECRAHYQINQSSSTNIPIVFLNASCVKVN